MADLIFIGGIGKPNEFGGELSKNKLILGRLKALGYKVIAIDTYKSHSNPLKIWRLPAIIAAYPHTPIVFSTNYSNIELMVKLISRVYPKRKLTFWIIGGMLAEGIKNGKYSVKDLNVFSTAIGESQQMCKNLQSLGLTNTLYMPNFKDMSHVISSTDKAGSLKQSLRCVFMSRVSPYKGVDIILDALEDDRLKGKNISVDFYGLIDQDYKEKFLNRIADKDNISYGGTLNFFDGSGQQTLSQYHLSLFPTFWNGEGFPGAIIDSLAAGVPVLASDWRFNTEFINEDTGFVCKAKDVEDFTDKLSHIYTIRESLSPLFDTCHGKAREFDVERLIDRNFVENILI